MILQAFEGLSDREAVDRLGFDLRWQAAAGVAIGTEPFHPTVLVGARNRLRASVRPPRLFEDTKITAKAAGALGQRARVLDPTPGKPPREWDDRTAREALVDALVRDAIAALDVVSDHEIEGATKAAAELLALVAGQDVAEEQDGVFRIVRGGQRPGDLDHRHRGPSRPQVE